MKSVVTITLLLAAMHCTAQDREVRIPQQLKAAPEMPHGENYKASSKTFEASKGKLLLPVYEGKITDHFGNHPHPVAKDVRIDNNGIDITAAKHASVHSVFEGKVVSLLREGNNTNTFIMVVQHGIYFTVYNGIENPSVKSGAEVIKGQEIGTLGLNSDGNPILNFQIWLAAEGASKQKLNPEEWIVKG